MMWPEKIIFLFQGPMISLNYYWSQQALDLELEKWLLASRPASRRQREDSFFFLLLFSGCGSSPLFPLVSAMSWLRLNCWWRLSYGASCMKPVWCIWIMLSLARHSRNSLNTYLQCFSCLAELTSHLTQRSVSYSRRNCSYNGESAKKCDHWPREAECSAGLTDTREHIHKGVSLGCVHTKRGLQLETLKSHCH